MARIQIFCSTSGHFLPVPLCHILDKDTFNTGFCWTGLPLALVALGVLAPMHPISLNRMKHLLGKLSFIPLLGPKSYTTIHWVSQGAHRFNNSWLSLLALLSSDASLRKRRRRRRCIHTDCCRSFDAGNLRCDFPQNDLFVVLWGSVLQDLPLYSTSLPCPVLQSQTFRRLFHTPHTACHSCNPRTQESAEEWETPFVTGVVNTTIISQRWGEGIFLYLHLTYHIISNIRAHCYRRNREIIIEVLEKVISILFHHWLYHWNTLLQAKTHL